ncbi:DUF3800 domain-containing protein [Legionella sainthelensi]|uniref:DUF3800 domain-containing protein n=1 Tax=Legionella sainthelensi TaxID=28087 RepID=UPI0013590B9C|nr:DUF3800 domain-containing protein [Legionella sainthelensi]
MYFIYIDDSGENNTTIFVALAVPEKEWQHSFTKIKDFRRGLKAQYGIPIGKELHSWKLVSGRGKISNRILEKSTRVEIFNKILNLTASLPGIKIFPAINIESNYIRCFERLLNRIQRTIRDSDNALIFCDEGHSNLTKLRRKLQIHNPIPSNQNISPVWLDTNTKTKNIATDNIIEDIIYKNSKHCCFIQLADACAYALLRKEKEIASKNKLGLNNSFIHLDINNALVLKGIINDPHGVIR